MRLLNIHDFSFREFYGDSIPPYIIASHRWTDDEVSFKDVVKKRKITCEGWRKIEGFCERVKEDNELLKTFENATCCDYLWIDTCCINNHSSREVSESINSMFQWYSLAQECYTYLADVRAFPNSQDSAGVMEDFRQSEWFKRGWTLQELLAPRCVIFFTRSWEIIGHKCAHCHVDAVCEGAGPLLNDIISDITGIPLGVLREYDQSRTLSVVERMKWQVNRRTTRVEDRAYCLLGLFDVYIPLLYSEGERAMFRLEQAILEELQRPWRSQAQLLLPFIDNPCASSSKTSLSNKRVGRPLMIMRTFDVEGEVSCICGYADDDGFTIACDECAKWQHSICYYPEHVGQSQAGNLEHRCIGCHPRKLDSLGARIRQRVKRGKKRPSKGDAERVRPAAKKQRILEDALLKKISQLSQSTADHSSKSYISERLTASSRTSIVPSQDFVGLAKTSSFSTVGALPLEYTPSDTDFDPVPHPIRNSPRQRFRYELGDVHAAADANSEFTGVDSTCPIATCGRRVLNVKAHMLSHQARRPWKCQIASCEYNAKGFARKNDQNRHMLTHFKGTIVCAFCLHSDKRFDRVDIFKRHLMEVHAVQQNPPNSSEQKLDTTTALSSNRRIEVFYEGSSVCMTCERRFMAQDFFNHLDGCILSIIQQDRLELVTFDCSIASCASAGVGFASKDELIQHNKNVHGDTRQVQLFDCPHLFCDRKGDNGFTRRDRMLEHQRHVHNISVGRRPHAPQAMSRSFDSSELTARKSRPEDDKMRGVTQ